MSPTSTSQRLPVTRFAAPVVGLAASGLIAAVVVGSPPAAWAQEPGTVQGGVRIHDRTEAEDNALPVGERHGPPYATIQTILRTHYLAEDDPGARRQGPPYASVTYEPVVVEYKVAIPRTRLVNRFQPGWHDHHKQWHTNRFYNANLSPQYQYRGCWEWEYNRTTGTCAFDQDPYFGGRYYAWKDHWNDWIYVDRDYHDSPTFARDVDPDHPNDCTYNGRKVQYDPGWYRTNLGVKTPTCGWQLVSESYTEYEVRERVSTSPNDDPPALRVVTPVVFEREVRIPAVGPPAPPVVVQPS